MVPTTGPKIHMDAPLGLCSCWCGQAMENLPFQVIYFTYDPCYRNIRPTLGRVYISRCLGRGYYSHDALLADATLLP